MLTRERLLQEMAESEHREEDAYLALTLDLLNQLQTPLRDLYDTMVAVTGKLRLISAQVVQDHPRIIKMLRYTTAPAISQMRLGQIAGCGSTSAFEEQGAKPTPEQAERLARWFRDHLDHERFPWVSEDKPALSLAEQRIAEQYAKLWTVSLIANQNTATKYRNLRKARQEEAIARVLTQAGLSEQRKLGLTSHPISAQEPAMRRPSRQGGIQSLDDVLPDHYVREQKILFGKRQKADLTARPRTWEQLLCIEAKAVGIRLDSTKRLKELNDKQTDWANSGLPIITGGVCAGYFNAVELIATIRGRGIPIFWEHNLDQLVAFVSQKTYYGSSWNPVVLFPDVPIDTIQAGLEAIKESPRSVAEERELYPLEGEQDER